MIRSATRDDFAAIRELLIEANDAPYDIAPVAEEKCFGEGFFGEARVRVFEVDRAVRGVAVTCGEYLRLITVHRELRERGIGSALLDDSGATMIAAEPGNYFTPGVIEPAFFVKRGFQSVATTWNLIAPTDGDAMHTAATDIPRMLDFVERHFGKIWRFEAERAQIAHSIDNIGFAVAEANNRGLGTFGPLGVAKEHRGKGHGRRLLRACLHDLRVRGFERVIIPWTSEIDFYRRSCGAEPHFKFVTLKKRYSSPP